MFLTEVKLPFQLLCKVLDTNAYEVQKNTEERPARPTWYLVRDPFGYILPVRLGRSVPLDPLGSRGEFFMGEPPLPLLRDLI